MVRLSEISDHEELKVEPVNLASKMNGKNRHLKTTQNGDPATINNAHAKLAKTPKTDQDQNFTVVDLGKDNLGYIENEADDDIVQKVASDDDGSSLEPLDYSIIPNNLPRSERKYSVRQECQFVKARRNYLQDVRKRLGHFDENNVPIREEKIRVDVFIKLFGSTDILDKLFRLFDYHQVGKLNQDKWIESLKSALNSIGEADHNSERRVDFVEVVESVAYAVCGDSDVSFEQFRTILKTKNVLNKFYHLIDQDLDGVVTAEQIMEFISQLSSARSGSRLTKENIIWLENLFRQYVGEDKEIKKEDFSKIIQTKNQFFTDRVFDIFDGDASGSISLQEFLDATHKFAGEDPEDKILFLFKVYDVDGDGLIQEAELEQVMRACMEENGMKFSDDQIHELTKALFEDADVEGRGTLTYDALKAQLQKHNGLLENLSISIERWLVPPKPKPNENDRSMYTKIRDLKPHEMSRRYVKNNYVYLLWLIGFIAANICLFVTRAVVYQRDNPTGSVSLLVARAAGQCLNFNCVFIVIVMLRQSLTYLRSHGASSYIPIDRHIYFHKKTGQLIFFFGVLHSVMHLVNIEHGFVHSHKNTSNFTYVDFLFQPDATQSLGLVSGCAMYTGLALILILIIMVICSLPFVRRGGSFEVFYWTHLLYVPFWILLILHAPNFWKWFLVPGFIFVIEQAVRVFYWRVGKGKSYISSGILLPSKVTHLIIRRPTNFDFHPGDYVFIRIPKIAKYEWHPFTISSGPEQEDALCLHIRAVGEWTNRLYDYFEQEQSKLSGSGLEKKPDTFFKMPLMNRKMILQRRIESIYNASNNNTQRSIIINPIVAIDEGTKRAQLKSVADSNSTIIPTSEHSSSSPTYQSYNDVCSSGDGLNNDQITVENEKNAPARNGKRPPLLSTKSMPDVHERICERERKMYFRQMIRSESAYGNEGSPSSSTEEKSSFSNVQNPFGSRKASLSSGSSAHLSLRYMRNKPKIISLKPPKGEDTELKEELLRGSYSRQKRSGSMPSTGTAKMAEEGRSKVLVSFNSDNGDYLKCGSIDGSSKEDEIDDDEDEVAGNDSMAKDSAAAGQALEIFVDGPYGAPSSHIFRAQHAVLIATGIGVTPFASILQSIMRRYWASRNTCPNCTFTWCSELPQSVLNLRKVDFFWINRDQRSFEWFVHLLSQLEIEQAELGGAMERFLDMHMYITSALQRTDMKAVGLQLALDLLHEKEKRDLITGLKTRTNAGRPNWNKIFQQLKDQQKGKVTVFYCGPPELARTLKRKCDEFDFSFRKELF